MASFTFWRVREIAHTGAGVDRTVEGEQSACQGEKAWRINTDGEIFGGGEGEGTQGAWGHRAGTRRAREITKRSQFAGGCVGGEERMTKRSQSGVSKGAPAGMCHRLQCSAGRVGISVKWLILFGELVVNKNRSMDH
jgi:hypothetical protein